MTAAEQQLEYRTISFLVSAIANICTASPTQIIDELTGLTWDEGEAEQIKEAFAPRKD